MDTPFPAKSRLLALAWPIFVEQGLRVLIGTVDTLMVSRVGDDAVAGVSVANQIVTLFVLAFSFIGIGSSVVITHHLGARDRAGADRITVTAISVNMWIGVATSVVVLLFPTQLLRVMALPAGPFEYAKPFLAWMGGTLFLEALSVAMAATLRAHTHTRDAMIVTGAQNVCNVIGNCLLLFGLCGFPRLGVMGVAISSVFSRFLACIALWILVKRRTQLRLRVRDFFHFPRRQLGRVLHIGLPSAGEHISWWTAFLTVTTFVARMGAAPLATFTYTTNIIRWVILVNVSIGLGTEIIIGHLIGAGHFDAAYKELLRSLRLALTYAVGGSAVLAVLAPYLIGGFTNNASIVVMGSVLIRLGLILEPGRAFNVVVINSLRAAGDARFPVMMGILSMWGVWVPLAWLLGLKFGLGLTGVWISMICDEWIRGLLMYWRWRSRRWLPAAERSRALAQHQAPANA